VKGPDPRPGTPLDWLRRARADLALARVDLPPGGFYEDLCFHAQQAAEKAIKAVYQLREWRFRYVHNIEELLTGLRQGGEPVPSDLDEATRLTQYAFETRYPGFGEPVTRDEYERAVKLAGRVVEWAAALVEGKAS